MQWLGIAIFLGILILLFLACMYLSNSQQSPKQRSGSAVDDFYHARGMGNLNNARQKLDGIARDQKRHP